MAGALTCKGSIEQFDNLQYSYRAEIQYGDQLYKLWREKGFSRRLEIFRGTQLEPNYSQRFVFYEDLQKVIPDEIFRSEDWTIYMLIPSGGA